MTVKKKSPKKADANEYPVLESHLRSLKLPAILSEYSQAARRCSQANASYETYLQEVASIELGNRDTNAISRRIKASRLPSNKELADFDFSVVPTLNKAKVIELSKCSYVGSHTNIVLMGPPGVGKTH